ncbi:La domain containing protein [Histomonas meleagridis]|uniref:La domain containing protein n=1 Tax=Histomonas meleagridis TaxID=135588 RepID=UPI00355A27BE|nr:La domain containing protein [Histomonas meleagridis]KAH0801750.1 La domain containing protein [Histomonas meleagridis]
MKAILDFFAKILGFEKDPNDFTSSESEDRDFPDPHPNRTLRMEQLQYYFSGNNLENDEVFRTEIEKNPEGYVSYDFLLKCNRLRQLKSTPKKLFVAGCASAYLDADEQKGIKSKKPFVSDPRRAYRTIRVSGFRPYVPLSEQEEFFTSIPDFAGLIEYIGLERRYDKDTDRLVYTGTTTIEFKEEGIAQSVLERGIQYNSKDGLKIELLSDFINRTKKNLNNRNNKQRSPRRK